MPLTRKTPPRLVSLALPLVAILLAGCAALYPPQDVTSAGRRDARPVRHRLHHRRGDLLRRRGGDHLDRPALPAQAHRHRAAVADPRQQPHRAHLDDHPHGHRPVHVRDLVADAPDGRGQGPEPGRPRRWPRRSGSRGASTYLDANGKPSSRSRTARRTCSTGRSRSRPARRSTSSCAARTSSTPSTSRSSCSSATWCRARTTTSTSTSTRATSARPSTASAPSCAASATARCSFDVHAQASLAAFQAWLQASIACHARRRSRTTAAGAAPAAGQRPPASGAPASGPGRHAGRSASGPPPSGRRPAAPTIPISAANIAFSTTTLEAPAGTPFSIDVHEQRPGRPAQRRHPRRERRRRLQGRHRHRPGERDLPGPRPRGRDLPVPLHRSSADDRHADGQVRSSHGDHRADARRHLPERPVRVAHDDRSQEDRDPVRDQLVRLLLHRRPARARRAEPARGPGQQARSRPTSTTSCSRCTPR